jgi:hypothetical protein
MVSVWVLTGARSMRVGRMDGMRSRADALQLELFLDAWEVHGRAVG